MAVITYIDEIDEVRGIKVGDKCRVIRRESETLVFIEFLTGACKGQELGMRTDQISSEED